MIGGNIDNRDFSDGIKLEAIKLNLKSNNGEIHCEICNSKLLSIDECHFDHIYPYAKGGKSTLSNCQILCVNCNLKKNDKELKDFVLEEKAKNFLNGKPLDNDKNDIDEKMISDSDEMTKELFDKLIDDFIERKGDIHKVDFGREYNHLPSIHYVRQYYGDFNNLKKAFGIEDISLNWNRENIKKALDNFIQLHGSITQNDLTKANNMPSLPCILNYYPEYKNFTDIKRGLCNIDVPELWTVENAISAGKAFAKMHEKITQKDLRTENHLPTANVIYKLFGSMAEYQRVVSAMVAQKNDYISKQEINDAVEEFLKVKNVLLNCKKSF